MTAVVISTQQDSLWKANMLVDDLKIFLERLDHHIRGVDAATKLTQHLPDSQLKRAKKLRYAVIALMTELQSYGDVPEKRSYESKDQGSEGSGDHPTCGRPGASGSGENDLLLRTRQFNGTRNQ